MISTTEEGLKDVKGLAGYSRMPTALAKAMLTFWLLLLKSGLIGTDPLCYQHPLLDDRGIAAMTALGYTHEEDIAQSVLIYNYHLTQSAPTGTKEAATQDGGFSSIEGY